MDIQNWPVDRLIPYARNPREISQVAVDKVAASINEFGWQQPIVVDPKDVIIVGHARLLAALKLGLKEVPVHVATALTPEQVKAYRLMDNRVSEEALWDHDLLALELSELAKLPDFDMTLSGFDDLELDSLLSANETPPLDTTSDEVGDYDETKFWPKIELRVPGDVMDRYNHLMSLAHAAGETDHARFAHLLSIIKDKNVDRAKK